MVFSEVIDNTAGVVIDGPNSFGAYAFGAFGVPPEPMNSAKLATRQKTWFMSSPLAIVASIIEENPDESTTFNNDNELTTQFQGNEVTLRLDDQNHLPISAETLEFDPLLGDVVYKVEYADWQAVGDTYYPQQVIHKLDAHVIRDEALSNLQIGEVDQTNFDFAGIEPNTRNADKAASGYLSSQFYVRGLMMGFPFDAIDETAIVSEFIDNEDKVLRILGTDHYSYGFLIDEHIYIYDAPVNNARQQAVLAEVQQKFPGKEIGGVILSHNHFDHAGGFRGALAEGGDLYVGSSSADFYQALLTRPHSLQPNPLQLRDSVSVNAIDGVLVLGEGTETLEIYTVTEGHAEDDDMLILYRPSDKTLFFGDLFNSGFATLQGFFPELAPTIKKRAQFLVDFVELHELDVETIAPLHGDVANDNSYESVIAAAAFE